MQDACIDYLLCVVRTDVRVIIAELLQLGADTLRGSNSKIEYTIATNESSLARCVVIPQCLLRFVHLNVDLRTAISA